MADEPPPPGRNFIEMLQTIFFVHVILCAPKIFFKIVNFSAIENHLQFTFLYDVYTKLQLQRPISLFILIFFTYFLFGNVSNRSWVKSYGMVDEPLPYLTKCSTVTSVKWTPLSGSGMGSKWHFNHMSEYFFILQSNWQW